MGKEKVSRRTIPTAETIIREYEKAFEPAVHITQGTYGDVNTSNILTRLIQETGRFAETYASDLFLNWQIVEDIIGNGDWEKPKGEEVHYLIFGIRENGVDTNAYLIQNLLKTRQDMALPSDEIRVQPKQVYRRIMAVKIHIRGNYINMGLKDLTNGFRSILAKDAEAMKEKGA